MTSNEPAIAISALQHWLYCPRQCALIHLDQEWQENRFTAEGRSMHERAHSASSESRPGIRIARGLRLVSQRLHLTGQADVVEFCKDGQVIPVEYKRGRPKAHRADEVQLAAQALCLEEMLNVSIREGFLFYGQPRRRTVVPIDTELRELVASTASCVQTLLQGDRLPPALYEKRKCGACSLVTICQPQANRSASAWLEAAVADSSS